MTREEERFERALEAEDPEGRIELDPISPLDLIGAGGAAPVKKGVTTGMSAAQAAVRSQGLSGVFEVTVKVGGTSVTVRGKVIDGAARIGTAFKP